MALRPLPLIVALLFAAVATAVAPTSEACTQPEGPPGHAPAARVAFATAATPKNAGLLLNVYSGELTDDEVRARTTIEVRKDDALIAGTFQAVASTTAHRNSGLRPWHWRPEAAGDLPVGELRLRVTVRVDGAERTEVDTAVTIVDRTFTTPTLPVTSVTASRLVVEVDDAPPITCKLKEPIRGGCGGESDAQTTRTKHRVVPQIGWQVAQPSSEDQPFVRQEIALYGRDEAGAVVTEDRRIFGDGVVTYLERAHAQYCVELTTRSLVDATQTRTERCIPGTLSLALSTEENEDLVEGRLARCTPGTIAYPPGTSEDDPTGRGGGCSSARGAASSDSVGVSVIGLALLALRARRRLIARP